MVIMQLIKSYCQLLLVYACECFPLLHTEIALLFWAWNCIYRRFLSYSSQDIVNDISARTIT